MKELFETPKNPSRATLARRELTAWKKKTGVWTHYARGVDEPWTAFEPGVTFERVAAECDRLEQSGKLVNAESERDACRKLAANLGLHFPGDVATPNDPKLSDGGAWRGSCVVERSEGIRARVKGGSDETGPS